LLRREPKCEISEAGQEGGGPWGNHGFPHDARHTLGVLAARTAAPASPFRARIAALSLATRAIAASLVLAALVAAVFAVLVLASSSLRSATRREARAKDVTAETLALEKLVLDIETGVRGFVLTDNERFLDSYHRARRNLGGQLTTVERLVTASPDQRRRARALGEQIHAYIEDYAAPLIQIARENPPAARAPLAFVEGKRRLDELRRRFGRFLSEEDAEATASASSADRRSNRALGLGIGGLVLSTGLIVGFGLYLARSIRRPLDNVAEGAGRLAAGDLSLRLDEEGPGEIGALTRSFNTMAEALQKNRSELEAQNRKLRESERLKSELVSIVSHELRTPLTSVLGFTSMLVKRDLDEASRRQYLEIVDSQTRRLSALVDRFLDLQRIEEGRLDLTAERVDLGGILREQGTLYVGPSERHRLRVRLEDEPLEVVGDPERLSQVVGNLLSNAVKYSPDGGEVEIDAARHDGVVRVHVRDAGIGIPESHRAKIFTKFHRGDAGATGISGTGLGLAITRDVVEAHGGRIGFVSSPGRGSTFWFELPAANGEAPGRE
jgi:two-component system sensor histidine kinase/response regulator